MPKVIFEDWLKGSNSLLGAKFLRLYWSIFLGYIRSNQCSQWTWRQHAKPTKFPKLVWDKSACWGWSVIQAQLAAECHFVWIKTLLSLTFCCSSFCCGPGLAPGMDVTSFSLFIYFLKFFLLVSEVCSCKTLCSFTRPICCKSWVW